MPEIEISFPEERPGKIKKLKVSIGNMITAGKILLLYEIGVSPDHDKEFKEKKLRATQFGRVVKILKGNDSIVQPSEPLLVIEGCMHPTVMKDLCAECGADLRQESSASSKDVAVTQASVPMLHSIPELKVCPELAEKIGKEDEQRLLRDKKLVLLVDLDQTIVHTTNDNIPANLNDVYHFQLYGPNSPWYHTRLRPHTREFLTEISKYYELHICTFGARNYAHKVASILDSDGVLFSHRILSRDECFDPLSKTANLKALFPCGVDMVCIIDDREDVWQGCNNLVQVKPYHFFLHTGDINAPIGLGKQDDPNPSNPITNNLLKLSEESLNSKATENGDSAEKKVDEEPKIDGVVKKSDEPKDDIKPEEKNHQVMNNENKYEDKSKEELKTATKNSEKDEKKDTKIIAEDQIEDQDDYLLYLEDILKKIHNEFYKNINQDLSGKRSLKDIIPRVRSQTLKGVNITFSSMVPNHQKVHESRAFKVARAFGAQVSETINEKTTHLVALQQGTQKVHEASRKEGKIQIVNPEWLWTCAERWEHVDERLFPLSNKIKGSRVPPPHCSSPAHVSEETEVEELPDKPEGKFAYCINPLMVFSKEDIQNMGKEVDEDMSDQDLSDNDYNSKVNYEDDDSNGSDNQDRRKRELDNDSDSNPFGNYDSQPACTKRKKLNSDDSSSSGSDNDKNSDDEDPVTLFRRGGPLPDNLSLGEDSQDSVEDLEADDMTDEREWNAMGAALERDFLSD